MIIATPLAAGALAHVTSALTVEGMKLAWSIATATAVAASLIIPSSVASADRGDFKPAVPMSGCSVPNILLRDTPTDLSQVSSGKVRIKGYTIDFKASRWKANTPKDPTVSQFFHTSSWVVAVSRTNPELAVSLLLQQAAARPDTGVATGEIRTSSGWSESQVTKRMWTVLCVLNKTLDSRLVPVLENLAKANMDEARYYGPPRRVAHNHGTFANEVLMAASLNLDRPAWAQVALQRFKSSLDETFEPCGMAYEQSATYHAVNVRLWARILDKYPSLGANNLLAKPRVALSALARPDGVIDPIGDGESNAFTKAELDAMGVAPGGSVWCVKSGWLADHRDLGEGVSHVVARFGPKQALHGDNDHTSVTWWVGSKDGVGESVLTERGLFSKERTSRYEFINSDQAHSVLSRESAPFTAPTKGVRVNNPGASSYKFSASQSNGSRTRVLTYSNSAPVLGVSDTISSKVSSKYNQYWQLGPTWRPASSSTAVSANGDTLRVVCLVNGKRTPARFIKVEHFPGPGQAVDSFKAVCDAGQGVRARIDTILVLNSDVRVSSGKVVTKYGTFSVAPSGVWSTR